MNNTIPDGLPTLSAGAHKPGSGKACVMEYVSLLAGEEWTDTPKCTNPVLARAAQRVNDALDDSERHRLVPLIGRLFGTDAPIGEGGNLLLQMMALASPVRTNYGWMDTSITATNVDGVRKYALTNSSGRMHAVEPDRGIAFLSALIDEYDRLAGRTTHRTVTPDDLRTLAATVQAGAR